jgi:hypothetical protein
VVLVWPGGLADEFVAVHRSAAAGQGGAAGEGEVVVYVAPGLDEAQLVVAVDRVLARLRAGRVRLVVPAGRFGERAAERYGAIEVTVVTVRGDGAEGLVLARARRAAYEVLRDVVAAAAARDRAQVMQAGQVAGTSYVRRREELKLGPAAAVGGGGNCFYEAVRDVFKERLAGLFGGGEVTPAVIQGYVRDALAEDFGRYVADAAPDKAGGGHRLADALWASGVDVGDEPTRQRYLAAFGGLAGDEAGGGLRQGDQAGVIIGIGSGAGARPPENGVLDVLDVAFLALGLAATVLGPGSARHAGDPGLEPAAYLFYDGERFRAVEPGTERVRRAELLWQAWLGTKRVRRAERLWRVPRVKVADDLRVRVLGLMAGYEWLISGGYERARAAAGGQAAFAAEAEPAIRRFRQVLEVFERERTSHWLLQVLTWYEEVVQLVAPLAGTVAPPGNEALRPVAGGLTVGGR